MAGATGRIGGPLVEVLEGAGHDVVRISRSAGVDVVTGEGLAGAMRGVECVVDPSSGPSPEQEAATAFFTAAARNLQEEGRRAGVRRLVVISIIGTDRFTGGYGAAKLAHERTAQEGPVPALILRAAQFHEFVGQLLDWGRRGDVATCRGCVHSWSPRGLRPRRWRTWPPGRRPRPVRSPRSPDRARRT